jgi:CRP-like cAMP-binding protein
VASLPNSRPARGNYLLSRLSDDTYAALAPMLQRTDLHSQQMLHEQGQPFSSHVYFPITSLVSVIVSLQDGTATEVACMGNDGFTGAEMFIGAHSPINTYFCQVSGQAWCISVADFRQALQTMPELRWITNTYLQIFINRTAQAGACTMVHAWEGRFACWLLQIQDRTGKNVVDLSRESMAEMLNVPRQNVTSMAGAFNKAGLIQYQDGQLRILNRQGLEEVSCECYGRDRETACLIAGNEPAMENN